MDETVNYDRLAAWFQLRPDWTQVALGRLLAGEEIGDPELAELMEACLKQAVDGRQAPTVIPLEPSLLSRTSAITSLRLTSMAEIKGIDALGPREPLTFGDEPLTIVYGPNGSGKSSYVRVLSGACGSKSRRRVKSNVFKPPEVPSCKLKYSLDGSPHEVQWTPSNGQINDLIPVSIYDQDAGLVYVNSENEVTYEPWLLGVFQDLIRVSDQLAALFERSKAALVSAKPKLPLIYQETAHGKWYEAVSSKTSAADVHAHCVFGGHEVTALAELRARLSTLDPHDQARSLRARSVALRNMARSLRALIESLSNDVAAEFRRAHTNVRAAHKAAVEDAEAVFARASVKGVGQESWLLLWEAARQFSEKSAYVDQAFPVTDPMALCVLCHQLIDAKTADRMMSFESYVKGALRAAESTALSALSELESQLPAVPSEAELKVQLLAAGVDGSALAGALSDLRGALESRRKSILSGDAGDMALAGLHEPTLAECEKLAVGLDKSAVEYEEDATKKDTDGLRRKVTDLEAQQWVAAQLDAVLAEIVRCEEVDKYNAAIKLTSTTQLSQKKSELSELLVSKAFIGRFRDELALLGGARIKVQLTQTRTAKGRTYHEIQLAGAAGKPTATDVLSEGELRIVSLAAFLADVRGATPDTPFVFDDPISSLDQEFEERVVLRMAQLALERQVLVFTHRISLLTLLADACKGAKLEANVVALRREVWGAGEPGKSPLGVLKPEAAINTLLSERVPKARKELEGQGRLAYDELCKGICSDLRIIIERMVEDTLVNQVIKRYRRAVQTKDMIGSLAKINPADCALFDEYMTKYSRFEHSQADEAPLDLPEPDELDADLKRLKAWHVEFKGRAVPPTK